MFAFLFLFVCDTNWISELPKAKSQSIFICVTGFIEGGAEKNASIQQRVSFFSHTSTRIKVSLFRQLNVCQMSENCAGGKKSLTNEKKVE